MSSVRGLGLRAVLLSCAWLSGGCLDRPVIESRPTTTNAYVSEAAQNGIDKIDLLFMVDNSASMADKQDILRDAVPVLVKRLTSPACVDPVTRQPNGSKSPCTVGEPEFPPVNDIHVGIVTSSLGAHGGTQCAARAGFTPNDNAHLLGTVRPTGSNADPTQVFDASKTWNNSGFLAWDANQIDQPPGSNDANGLKNSFQDMIVAAGERGCGFEASLEAWYRFLIDPEPPASVTKDMSAHPQTVRGSALLTNADGSTTCMGCDQEILTQRKAFLRPDSLLAIVMLSDENDCSVRDDSVGWLVGSGTGGEMPRSTTACAANPNDPCCRSCADGGPPNKGCPATADDPICKAKGTAPVASWDAAHDNPNLRCFDQKRRFGLDLLYPTSRYVDALTKTTLVLQSDGKTEVPNPLYAPDPKFGVRPTDHVFLAGIVGVPWQDIADDASLAGAGLKYLSAEELEQRGRWAALLGDPDASPPVAPSDPFMRETPDERSGMNPITHDPIVPASSPDPLASPINGHEHRVPALDDLQYACTFQLTKTRPCMAGDTSCDCSAVKQGNAIDTSKVETENSPLCQPAGGGTATTEQRFAKAYPGTRELGVLKGLGKQGIVASICPKVTAPADPSDPSADPSYGYNPAVAAIIDRLGGILRGHCLPRAIETDPDTHQVRCALVEAQAAGCDCNAEGRGPVDPRIEEAVQRELASAGRCGGPKQPACASFCQCEIKQESGAALDACRLGQPAPAGYCYIDDPSSPLVAECGATQKHALRFIGSADGVHKTPADGAFAFIACAGAPVASASDAGK